MASPTRKTLGAQQKGKLLNSVFLGGFLLSSVHFVICRQTECSLRGFGSTLSEPGGKLFLMERREFRGPAFLALQKGTSIPLNPVLDPPRCSSVPETIPVLAPCLLAP